ncbi:hypothetical protein ACRWXK_23465, partial [Escherichia coli]
MAMLQLDVRGLVVSASSDAAMLERGEKKPPRGVRGGKSACGSGRKKPRRRSGRKTARPDVQLGHFSRIWGLTLSGTKTHVKQRFLPLTPLLMVSDVLWSPV